MLDHTKKAIHDSIEDFKKTIYINNIIVQCVYIIYLIYAIIAKTGFLAVNIILLVLSIAYFVFFLNVESIKHPEKHKKLKQRCKIIYSWAKRIIKFPTLLITIYGVCNTVTKASPMSIIMAAFMVVGWLLQLALDLLFTIISTRVNHIMDSLELDIAILTKPIKNVTNFFKKITGKKIEPEKKLTKYQKKLMDQVKQEKELKKQKKKNEKLDELKEKQDKVEEITEPKDENIEELNDDDFEFIESLEDDYIVEKLDEDLNLDNSDVLNEINNIAKESAISKEEPKKNNKFFNLFKRKK